MDESWVGSPPTRSFLIARVRVVSVLIRGTLRYSVFFAIHCGFASNRLAFQSWRSGQFNRELRAPVGFAGSTNAAAVGFDDLASGGKA